MQPPPENLQDLPTLTREWHGLGWGGSALLLAVIFGGITLFQRATPPVMPPMAELAARFNDGRAGLMDEAGSPVDPVDAVHEVTLCRVTQNGSRLWSDPMAYICLARGVTGSGPVYLLHDFRRINPVGGNGPVRWTGTSFHPPEWHDLMDRHDLHPADLPPFPTDTGP